MNVLPGKSREEFDYDQYYRRRRAELTRHFRLLKLPGRLYWRDSHNWRDWQKNAVAVYKSSNEYTWFLNWTSIDVFIKEMKSKR